MFCKKCGSEVKAGAKFCDNCGSSVDEKQPISNGATEQPKKLWEKTWFTWVMLFVFWPVGLYLLWKNQIGGKALRIIITIVFAAAGIAAFTGDKSPSDTTPSKTVVTKKEEPTWTCDVEGVGKVKGGISSNVGIAVYKIREARSIDTSFSSQRAQGKFIIVNVAVSNGQKDAITVDNTSFKLIDDQGREFSHSVEGSTALMMKSGNSRGFLQKVNPGIVTSVEVPFDVPTNISGLKLKARGGFSGREIVLPLKVDLVK